MPVDDVTLHRMAQKLRRECLESTAEAGSGAGFATPDVDYVSKSGILTIDPGQQTATISIAVKGDRIAEGPETFVVNIANPMNATIGDGQALATILDNEP